METFEIADPVFRRAVEAIDAGDTTALSELVENNPYLLTDPLAYPAGGYFKDPYLVYFIADNPIRNGKLAPNIVEITGWLINRLKLHATAANAAHQVNYTLGLVVTGRTPKESGVQTQLMDLLIDAGAHPGGALGALANGNHEAARHLIKRGEKAELATAVVLGMTDDAERLLTHSTPDEKLVAITAAAFYGDEPKVKWLLDKGVGPNGFPPGPAGFHAHATPLHQAVSSGSLACVQLLTEAGASLNARDKIFDGTPLDWAQYLGKEATTADAKRKFDLIGAYLQKQPS